jgi:hypothetical protein
VKPRRDPTTRGRSTSSAPLSARTMPASVLRSATPTAARPRDFA